MSFTSILTDYLGEGIAASRPTAPNVAPTALSLYFATDTGALSAYDVGTAAWVQILPENAWGVGTVTALGTIAGGVTLQNNGDTLQALGGWAAGAVSALGTVAGGATLGVSSGTLIAAIPSSATEWNAGTVSALGTVSGGATLAISSGTLTATIPADKWGPASVNALGTTAGGGTLSISSGTLSVLGGWTEGVITALGTVANGTTLANSSGTLLPSGGWAGGAVTNLGTVAGGVILGISTGTLEASVTQNSLYDIAIDLASTAALSPANTYNNGSAGVGATLTGTSNGNPSVDGSPVIQGNLVLINNEAADAHNGIYVVTQAGDSGTHYIFTRLPGADNPTALVYMSCYTGGSGNDNNLTVFLSQNAAPITIGTTGLFWNPQNTAGSTGVQIMGGAISVNWNGPGVTSLGTVANGATLGVVSNVLMSTGGWAGGAVANLGTVAGGVTLAASGGTLTVTGGWSAGSATAFGGSMSLNAGTLTNEAQGTLTLSGTTTGTVSPIAGFNSYLVNVGTAAGTISVASGSINGQTLRLDIKQGATAHTVSFDSTVIFGTDITSYTATTNPGSIDMVKLIWGGSEWRFAAVNHGFAA